MKVSVNFDLTEALRYLGRVSASAAGGLLETLVPRRKSAAERFFALDAVLVGDFFAQGDQALRTGAGDHYGEWFDASGYRRRHEGSGSQPALSEMPERVDNKDK
jgi:hypothetical protein